MQRVSLHPARRPLPSFTSRLVSPAQPSPDAAQPAKTPAGDADPSVSDPVARPALPEPGPERMGLPHSLRNAGSFSEAPQCSLNWANT